VTHTTTKNPTRPDDWPESWRAAADDDHCLHCGNPLGKFWREDDGPFCCRGCQSVYAMIHEADLERFYDLAPNTRAPAPSLNQDDFGWLEQFVDETAVGETLDLALDIQGVHCVACVWLIEELFKRNPAGIQLRINPTLGKVDLRWDPSRGDLRDFFVELEKFGYRMGPRTATSTASNRGLLMRMAIAIAMAMNVMIFSLSYYFGLAEGMLFDVFGWLSLGMATVSLLAGGGIFLSGALAGLRRRVLHLDVPISLGMVLAYLGSVYSFFASGPDHAYFDSLTVFIALMLIGRWAQERILTRNRNSLLASSGAEHITVKVLKDGDLQTVRAQGVRRGDELWVAPGDLLPVAAILMRSSVKVSLDWITGESDQVSFVPGAVVPAGAFNASDTGFSATASEDFASSRLQDLLRAPTSNDDDFHPRWWHLVSAWYVVAVLVVALGGFLFWANRDLSVAIQVTISILVVTCPCALGLATPLAEELTLSALRQVGVFVRKQSFMEKAVSVRQVLLDKTGTLTMGKLALSPASQKAVDELDETATVVLRHMTARSNHPVSACLAAAVGAKSTSPVSVSGENLREEAGQGLELIWGERVWRLGREEFATSGLRKNYHTVLACDGIEVAGFDFREDFKADAAAEVQNLQCEGLQVRLLSGDTQAKVDSAADLLGLERQFCEGALSPEAKAQRVAELDRHDSLMVGDGLNDSLSFESAYCAATPAIDRPVLPGKADFFFLGDGIASLRRALGAAHKLRQVIKLNLSIAVLYNVIAVGLCVAGLVTPVVAAIIMPLSSIAVVTFTAIRLRPGSQSWM
jgi:Cu2+-exporting ATPase